ncbi:hypothetical protein [Actinoplanes auranticolor]|uniref:Uncharacterized protein n=1 Tax=Actinoplanes auranticolor TaxID=47988 RepID=A0A919SLR2_9ACTN|nr:hypothetical protein [Actinoplanes auranticolor]GIM73008.1 hypothetical protein Aau02nite_53820 [Actinoplanes auranticolor]
MFWRPADAAPGNVGELTATVTVDADAEAANNSKSIPVVTSPVRSPVLQVSQETITRVDGFSSAATGKNPVEALDRAEVYNGKPIPPGGKGTTLAEISNYGAVTAAGLRTVGKLPAGVRFLTDGLDNCDFSADKRTATCVWTRRRPA